MSDILLSSKFKKNAPGEAQTHGLQIMRLTRCLLRYGGCYITIESCSLQIKLRK